MATQDKWDVHMRMESKVTVKSCYKAAELWDDPKSCIPDVYGGSAPYAELEMLRVGTTQYISPRSINIDKMVHVVHSCPEYILIDEEQVVERTGFACILRELYSMKNLCS